MGETGEVVSLGEAQVGALLAAQRPARFSAPGLTYAEASMLKALVAERSDHELEEAVRGAAGHVIVDVALRCLAAVSAPTVLSERITVQLSLRTSEGDALHYLRLDGEHRSHHRGMALNPRTTLMLRLATLLRIVAGEIDGTDALESGRIRVHADARFARDVLRAFTRPTVHPEIQG